MLKKDVIDHFQSASNVARALNISPAAVFKWGPVVPWFSAVELERITDGALKHRSDLYLRGRPIAVDDPAVVNQ